jgi:HIV Tat-specific factor 1
VQEVYAPKKNKWAKIAIMKNVFDLKELTEESDILDIKEDMRTRAATFGEVTKVVLYDKEPEGVVIVRFKDWESAQAFQKRINGEVYDERRVEITIAEDRPKFRKSGRDDDSDVE